MAENKSRECQTDEDLVYYYAWNKYYHHFTQHQSATSSQPGHENRSEPLTSTAIKEIAENSTGFTFDSSSGLYFDSQNALYYDQTRKIYVDDQKWIYYHYVLNERTQTYHLRYHSTMKKNDIKYYSQLIKPNKADNEVIVIDSESDESEQEPKRDTAVSYPPCIRAILVPKADNDLEDIESDLVFGSLFIIPYTGGSVGRSNNNLICFPSSDLTQTHASIAYDSKNDAYFIQDLSSENGTFLNEKRLEANEKVKIKHLDKVFFGSTICLSLHIHPGQTTCIGCEPGEVMLKYKAKTSALLKPDLESARRETLNSIRKKYGLKNRDFGPKQPAAGFVDRAQQRRESNKEEERPKTTQAASSGNIGFKLMSKMGWKEGKGLGKSEDGILEPIQAKMRLDNSGLGNNQNQCAIENMDERGKKKLISWNKARERYSKIEKDAKLSQIFGESSSEEDETKQ